MSVNYNILWITVIVSSIAEGPLTSKPRTHARSHHVAPHDGHPRTGSYQYTYQAFRLTSFEKFPNVRSHKSMGKGSSNRLVNNSQLLASLHHCQFLMQWQVPKWHFPSGPGGSNPVMIVMYASWFSRPTTTWILPLTRGSVVLVVSSRLAILCLLILKPFT